MTIGLKVSISDTMQTLNNTFSRFFLGLAFIASVVSVSYADGPVLPGSAPAQATSQLTGGVAGAPAPAPQQSPFGMMMPMLVMFGVVYFLMIRPQQKRAKQQQAMISALSHGDEVITQAGILGKISGIADKVVTLEVADNVKIKVMKSQVAQIVKGQIKDLA